VHTDAKELARFDQIGHAMPGTRKGQPKRTGARWIGQGTSTSASTTPPSA